MNGQGDGGGHTHEASTASLDAETQRKLDAQLAGTKPLMERCTTVADAEAAGYLRAGPYSPGLGAHYNRIAAASLNMDVVIDPVDLERPTLIFDGIETTSKLASFMFMIMSLDTENPPEGFAGSNDQRHNHTKVCITVRPGGSIDSPLGADTGAPKELCDKYGGTLIANTGYMVHVWTVPGYESPQGVFSNVNAKLTCTDGTYYTVTMEEIGHRTNVCTNVCTIVLDPA